MRASTFWQRAVYGDSNARPLTLNPVALCRYRRFRCMIVRRQPLLEFSLELPKSMHLTYTSGRSMMFSRVLMFAV